MFELVERESSGWVEASATLVWICNLLLALLDSAALAVADEQRPIGRGECRPLRGVKT